MVGFLGQSSEQVGVTKLTPQPTLFGGNDFNECRLRPVLRAEPFFPEVVPTPDLTWIDVETGIAQAMRAEVLFTRRLAIAKLGNLGGHRLK